MQKLKCHFCDEEIKTEPVVLVKENTTSRDGIESDVPVEYFFCSEECKNDWE